MSLNSYKPLPISEFLRVIANPVILNTAPNDALIKSKAFKDACHSIQIMVNLPEKYSHRLPPVVSAAVQFLQTAEYYDYFNLYGMPFITSFAAAIFGWNVRFLLAQHRFPDRRILIRGETGTGKEQVARLIGEIISGHNKAEFMAVNAANLSETLVEAELFGYEKGAFTGAVKSREGLLQKLSGGGVLFLDEVTETPPLIQAKLLRLLESGEYRPVGSDKIRTVDLSIVAATNRQDPFKYEGFRNDVLYRLSETVIELPPLREILESQDLAVSIYDHLIQSTASDMSKNIDSTEKQAFLSWVSEWSKSVARELSRKWTGYQWPGNIRECRNSLRHVIMNYRDLETGKIPDQLLEIPDPPIPHELEPLLEIPTDSGPVNLKKRLERLERSYYQWAAGKSHNIEAVAGRLGVTRQTASRRMKSFGIRTETGLKHGS